jgi:hypothetical protein
VPRSVVWPVRPPAGSSWACRPATDGCDLAAFGRVASQKGPSGLIARMVPLLSAPGGHECFRKS